MLSFGKDGSKPVDGSYRNDTEEDEDLVSETSLDSLKTVFSGRPGALSMLEKMCNNAAEPALVAALISEALPLHVVSRLAFMFNFQDSISLGGVQQLLEGSNNLCIQMADTSIHSRYTSAWSSGFSLSSVGVTQIVG